MSLRAKDAIYEIGAYLYQYRKGFIYNDFQYDTYYARPGSCFPKFHITSRLSQSIRAYLDLRA